jgi:hypothetical protein
MKHSLLQFFAYHHLPAALQEISAPFGVLAELMDSKLPNGAEKTTMLRKLMEAKDCAVRSQLFKE